MTQTTFQVDVMWDDFASPLAALIDLFTNIDEDDVLNIRSLPNICIWPLFEVTTANVEAARAIVARYLDVPIDDADVTEYLSY
jgi:hypothetical protein